MDQNLDLLKAHHQTKTQNFLELLFVNDLLPMITRPTRITKSTATLIDNIILSKRLQMNYICGILVDDMSDHLPNFARISNIKPSIKAKEKKQLGNSMTKLSPV